MAAEPRPATIRDEVVAPDWRVPHVQTRPRRFDHDAAANVEPDVVDRVRRLTNTQVTRLEVAEGDPGGFLPRQRRSASTTPRRSARRPGSGPSSPTRPALHRPTHRACRVGPGRRHGLDRTLDRRQDRSDRRSGASLPRWPCGRTPSRPMRAEIRLRYCWRATPPTHKALCCASNADGRPPPPEPRFGERLLGRCGSGLLLQLGDDRQPLAFARAALASCKLLGVVIARSGRADQPRREIARARPQKGDELLHAAALHVAAAS